MVLRIIVLMFFGAFLIGCFEEGTDFATHRCECHCQCQGPNSQTEQVSFDCETALGCGASNNDVCHSSGDDPWHGTLANCIRNYVPIGQ